MRFFKNIFASVRRLYRRVVYRELELTVNTPRITPPEPPKPKTSEDDPRLAVQEAMQHVMVINPGASARASYDSDGVAVVERGNIPCDCGAMADVSIDPQNSPHLPEALRHSKLGGQVARHPAFQFGGNAAAGDTSNFPEYAKKLLAEAEQTPKGRRMRAIESAEIAYSEQTGEDLPSNFVKNMPMGSIRNSS
jgi:hypothetical protein